jgi:hypothetical protein
MTMWAHLSFSQRATCRRAPSAPTSSSHTPWPNPHSACRTARRVVMSDHQLEMPSHRKTAAGPCREQRPAAGRAGASRWNARAYKLQ